MAVAANPQETFVWGKGGQKKTPEQVQRDREMAQLLIQGGADYSPVDHWLQGAARMVQGGLGGLQAHRANEAEMAGMERGKAAFDPILQALTGGAGSAGQSFAGAPGAGGASAGGGNSYRDAIASIESAGSGDYNAVGPTHDTLGRALGRYQVMEANIGPWSREALGREITPDEFMASPELQDAIFDHRFGSYVDQYGPQGAAQAWFAGPGGVGKMDRRDVLGTSVSAYTDKFTNAIGGAGGQPAQPVQVASLDPSIGMPAQLPEIGPSGGPQLSPTAPAAPAPTQEIAQALMAPPQGGAAPQQANSLLPLLLQASGDPWARKQYGGIIDALMGQQMQQMDPRYQQQLAQGDLDYQRGAWEFNRMQNPPPAPPEYAFTQLDDGTLVRTDKTSGTFENMGSFAKPTPGFRLMTADELKGTPGLDPSKAYQIGPDNRIYELGGSGGDSSAKEEQIARIVSTGVPKEIAIGIVDGVLKADRHPVTGELQVVDMSTGQPVYGGPQQPEMAPAATSGQSGMNPEVAQQFGQQFPASNQSFGVGGAAQGAINSAFDAIGVGAPYPDIQQTQADFGILRESLLNDIASAYGRQPPSWLLQEIRSLTPSAGNPLEGAGAATSKLNALGRHLTNELAIARESLQRQLTPANRQELEAKVSGLEAGIARVTGAIESFGGPAAADPNAPPPPEGISPEEWGALTPEERALWQ